VEYLRYFLELVQLMMVYLMGDFEDYPCLWILKWIDDFFFRYGFIV